MWHDEKTIFVLYYKSQEKFKQFCRLIANTYQTKVGHIVLCFFPSLMIILKPKQTLFNINKYFA